MVEQIREVTGGDCIIATDVGQHQMWACQYFKYTEPRQFISSGGLGTMGFGLPAAIGAQIGRPDKQVVDIGGDGSFQMTMQELGTAMAYEVPIVVAILNNRFLGMVRQWQELFWKGRYSYTDIAVQPDFAKIAEAYGAFGATVTARDEVADALRAAIKDPRPAVIDFQRASRGERLSDGAVGRHHHRDDRWRPRQEGQVMKHTLSVLVENKPGVLTRVAGLFARRGFNIESLVVGQSENPNMSRMTITIDAAEHPIDQVTKQLHKLINVLKIRDLDPELHGGPRAGPGAPLGRGRHQARRGDAARRAVQGAGGGRGPQVAGAGDHHHARDAGLVHQPAAAARHRRAGAHGNCGYRAGARLAPRPRTWFCRTRPEGRGL